VDPPEVVTIVGQRGTEALMRVVKGRHGAGRGGAMAFAPADDQLTETSRNDEGHCHEEHGSQKANAP